MAEVSGQRQSENPATTIQEKKGVPDYLPEQQRHTAAHGQQGRWAHTHGGFEMASFSVVTNAAASNAQFHLQATSLGLNKALTRL